MSLFNPHISKQEFNWTIWIIIIIVFVVVAVAVVVVTLYGVWRSSDRAPWYILIKNQLDALNSQIYFWNKTLHVSDSSSVHHQKFLTVHTAMVYVIQVCWELASRIRTELQFRPDPARKLSTKPVWYILLLCTVKKSWWWTEELSETCRVLFQKHIWEITASSWFCYKICTEYLQLYTWNKPFL